MVVAQGEVMQTVQAPLDSKQEQEEKQRAGYLCKPVKKGEVDIWEDEQVWGEYREESE